MSSNAERNNSFPPQDADLMPAEATPNYNFIPDNLRPEDLADEPFPPEQQQFLGGLVLPVVAIVGAPENDQSVIVTAASIADALERTTRLKSKMSANFWRGVDHQYRLTNRNFDPALGDIGRLVVFPREKGVLVLRDAPK